MTRFSRSSDRPMIGAQNILMGHIIEQPDLWRTFPFDAANRLFPYLRWCLILDENPCKLVESTADYVAREGTCGKNFFISCARDTFFSLHVPSRAPYENVQYMEITNKVIKHEVRSHWMHCLAVPCGAVRCRATPRALQGWELEKLRLDMPVSVARPEYSMPYGWGTKDWGMDSNGTDGENGYVESTADYVAREGTCWKNFFYRVRY